MTASTVRGHQSVGTRLETPEATSRPQRGPNPSDGHQGRWRKDTGTSPPPVRMSSATAAGGVTTPLRPHDCHAGSYPGEVQARACAISQQHVHRRMTGKQEGSVLAGDVRSAVTRQDVPAGTEPAATAARAQAADLPESRRTPRGRLGGPVGQPGDRGRASCAWEVLGSRPCPDAAAPRTCQDSSCLVYQKRPISYPKNGLSSKHSFVGCSLHPDPWTRVYRRTHAHVHTHVHLHTSATSSGGSGTAPRPTGRPCPRRRDGASVAPLQAHHTREAAR